MQLFKQITHLFQNNIPQIYGCVNISSDIISYIYFLKVYLVQNGHLIKEAHIYPCVSLIKWTCTTFKHLTYLHVYVYTTTDFNKMNILVLFWNGKGQQKLIKNYIFIKLNYSPEFVSVLIKKDLFFTNRLLFIVNVFKSGTPDNIFLFHRLRLHLKWLLVVIILNELSFQLTFIILRGHDLWYIMLFYSIHLDLIVLSACHYK